MITKNTVQYTALSIASGRTNYGPCARFDIAGTFGGFIYPRPVGSPTMRIEDTGMCNFTFCAPNGEILGFDVMQSNLDMSIRTLADMLPPF